MTARSKEICQNCEECFILKYLTENERNTLLERATQIEYRKKEMLFKQQSFQTNLYFLKSGLVKIFIERRNEKNLLLSICKSNQIINLYSLYNSIFDYSAITLTSCEICIFPLEDFKKVVNSRKTLADNFILEFSKANNFLLKRIASLGTKQMHGRMADVILYLTDKEFDEFDIFDSLSRKDIAEMAGMSVEGSIRLLTEFKNDGLIRFDGKKIVVNNNELINRLSEIG